MRGYEVRGLEGVLVEAGYEKAIHHRVPWDA